ncbi:MAG: hypothetical protein JSU57_05420 [Candidatus Heimdallarchaeota archaeon]|nr:MAG: hypothetical protein JSU57_05420 [Candidatus Heimdallarchaeota archaeon]
MFSEFVSIRKVEPNRKKTARESLLDKPFLQSKEEKRVEVTESDIHRLADRALLLLSFKDTSTQNLRYVLNVLGISTLEEKRNTLQEIYRLIREGIVYVPRGLPQLIDQGSRLDINNSLEAENIDICLLRPYEELIREIQNEITELSTITVVKDP